MLNNILLLCGLLSWLLILRAGYGQSTGGPDAATGTGMAVLFLGLSFWAFLALLHIRLTISGGIPWLNWSPWTAGGAALAVLTLGTALMVLAGFQLKMPPTDTTLLWRPAIHAAMITIPVVAIVLSAWSLYGAGYGPVTQSLARWLAGALTAGVAIASLSLLRMEFSHQREIAANQQISETEATEAQQAQWAGEIDAADPASPEIARILIFTSKYTDPKTRTRALEKWHAVPDWPDRLAEFLEGDAALEGLSFVADNDVPDPAKLASSADQAIRTVAAYVKRSIQNAGSRHDLYPDRFAGDVRRCLSAADRLGPPSGHDFLPALLELKQALNAPTDHGDVKFSVERELDKWLGQHDQ